MSASDVQAVRAAVARSLTDRDCGEPSVVAVALIRDAMTGARPLMVAGDDRHTYWAKGPGNPHGDLTLAHEWVMSEISRHIGGPLAPGVLLEVDDDLLQGWTIDGSRREAGTWFGSRLVSGEERTALQLAHRDGNPERIPYYLALWHLCLGVDAQFIYDKAQDDRVWSIDHGMWFANGDGDWNEQAGGLDVFSGQVWPDPDWVGSRSVNPQTLHDAADALMALSAERLGEITGSVPVQWNLDPESRVELAMFVLQRRRQVSDQLRAYAAQR